MKCACGGSIAQHLTFDGVERRCIACYRPVGATLNKTSAQTFTVARRGMAQRRANGTWKPTRR